MLTKKARSVALEADTDLGSVLVLFELKLTLLEPFLRVWLVCLC